MFALLAACTRAYRYDRIDLDFDRNGVDFMKLLEMGRTQRPRMPMHRMPYFENGFKHFIKHIGHEIKKHGPEVAQAMLTEENKKDEYEEFLDAFRWHENSGLRHLFGMKPMQRMPYFENGFKHFIKHIGHEVKKHGPEVAQAMLTEE